MLSARSEAAPVCKVTYKGDTKRIKLATHTFDELCQRTQGAFEDLPASALKFFYVDEESDLISVNCQADLTEALESGNPIKLNVASTPAEAHKQILKDANPLPSSQPSFIDEELRESVRSLVEADAQGSSFVVVDDQKNDQADELAEAPKADAALRESELIMIE